MSSSLPSNNLFATLITANHILHHNQVLDAYGHISVRNPSNPSTFYLSFSLAPALVSSRTEIGEYFVSSGQPVQQPSSGGGGGSGSAGYAERFIHSAVYSRFPSVGSVVHSHSEAILPFSVQRSASSNALRAALRPIFHVGASMGSRAAVFDVAREYRPGDERSLLIRSQRLGDALAATMSSSEDSGKENPTFPLVLMRGHGFTLAGSGVEEAVYRAVYTCANARVQMQALMLRMAMGGGKEEEEEGEEEEEEGGMEGGIRFLTREECEDAWEANRASMGRAWRLWCTEVEREGTMYRNDEGSALR